MTMTLILMGSLIIPSVCAGGYYIMSGMRGDTLVRMTTTVGMSLLYAGLSVKHTIWVLVGCDMVMIYLNCKDDDWFYYRIIVAVSVKLGMIYVSPFSITAWMTAL